MPTVEQQYTCFYLMQQLSNLFCRVEVFRYDVDTREVFVLALNSRDEEIILIVKDTGRYRFIND